MNTREVRGVIMTAAASLVLTASMVVYIVAGVGSGEISRDAYRQALTAKLPHDGRLAAPDNATDAEQDFYLTCLINGTYSHVTVAAREIVVQSDNIKTMHDSDLATLVARAETCRNDVVRARDAAATR
ncbi:hypothetical protein [Flaviflexus huanghaiensis]|uniref:hypothetical protein n=1 Tax=Flaviflexus huanghaiensis TaxID=1111473 RepID=UPI0015F9AFE9|nr:hypothetical protein [Flaviflexus huanghaiensis]